jgi:hypothetical protein
MIRETTYSRGSCVTTTGSRNDQIADDADTTDVAVADSSGQRDGNGGGPVGAPPLPEERRRRFRTFDSLIDVPAFRWYMGAMMGNWSALQMQQVARGYLAYQVTGSFAALGLVELANTWPRLFLALYGGVLADRASRRMIIQVGQAVNAVNMGIIAVLLFTGQLEFYHLILASFAQGVLNSFVLPARQAMIPEIVGPDRLMNAFASSCSIPCGSSLRPWRARSSPSSWTAPAAIPSSPSASSSP